MSHVAVSSSMSSSCSNKRSRSSSFMQSDALRTIRWSPATTLSQSRHLGRRVSRDHTFCAEQAALDLHTDAWFLCVCHVRRLIAVHSGQGACYRHTDCTNIVFTLSICLLWDLLYRSNADCFGDGLQSVCFVLLDRRMSCISGGSMRYVCQEPSWS